MLLPYLDTIPQVSPEAFLAEGARLIGDISVGAGSSIWFNTVVRGDLAPLWD